MHRLILLRHGQSQWNLENRFTGWTDVDLSPGGVAEAHAAARALAAAGLTFDVAFSSLLKRAIRTLWIVQEELDRMWVPTHLSWRLNERHYGALQGLNKADTAQKFGDEQVHRWRRSYALRPPLLEPSDPRCSTDDPRYAGLRPNRVPLGESLEDTVRRFLPCWRHCIAPQIREGRRVIIVAHGNSLRALVKELEGLSDSEVTELEIPTGRPLVYRLDAELRPVESGYLGAGDGG